MRRAAAVDTAAGLGLIGLAIVHLLISRDRFRAAVDLWRESR